MLKHSGELKILGTIFSEDLKWNKHLKENTNSLLKQLKTRAASIRNIRNIVDLKFARQLANSLFYSKLYYHLELFGSTTISNIKYIDREIVKLAKFLNGYEGIGRTNEWHLSKMKWLSFSELFKYSTAKYINKIIHIDEDHHFKDILLSNRRGRNLTNDKLSPLSQDLGRHSVMQHSILYYSNSIYNGLPNNLTKMDNKVGFKVWCKKFFLDKNIEIPLRPRLMEITQPYQIEIDECCGDDIVQTTLELIPSAPGCSGPNPGFPEPNPGFPRIL